MRSTGRGCWKFKSAQDVRQFWEKYRVVPSRINGRKHHHEERFNLGLYLLALADHALLSYPLSIDEGESPDFMVTWPSQDMTGLEVTRATDEQDERALSQSEREFRRRELEAAAKGRKPEPVITPIYAPGSPVLGWPGDRPEIEWCALFKSAIERKLSKFSNFRPALRYDLLVYDEALIPAVDRQKVLSMMHLHVRGLREQNPQLGETSLIVSLDVLYDVGGEARCFRYLEPPNLDDSQSVKTFFGRSEYAGQLSAKQAVREQIKRDVPIYSGEGTRRVLKHTSDGRRFEVTFREDGEEVIVRELTHK